MHVELRARAGDVPRDGPQVNARERADHVDVVQVDLDPAELCELRDLPEHDGRDAPLIVTEKPGLGVREPTGDRVQEHVRVKIQHAI